MTVVVRGPGIAVSAPNEVRRRVRRGYAASRQAYDKRRRAQLRSPDTQAFRELVRSDPCAFSFLGNCHDMIAADHITPLGAGGEEHWLNYSGVCHRHNASKKDRDLLGWLLDA